MTNAPTTLAAALPPGWSERVSKSTGKTYWVGDNGETTWERPAPAVPAVLDLPPGWGEKFSNSQQRPFWFKLADSSATVWERPTLPAT